VSGGQIVDSGYHNPYTHPTALEAEQLLLRTVVSALREHPAIWAWNLGNEPDLFAQPPDAATGRAWVEQMTALIRELDPHHPVTCGLHMDSLLHNNGLRADYVFDATDFAVMHAYPMYLSWARGPLDPDLVPFSCALTSALCGKPVLMEEFGGCTAPPGAPSQEWAWTAYGQPRTQFMASEQEFADYIAEVLPRLVQVGATGAFLWCFADYSSDLWQKPPCSESWHERFFGMVRPDGSLKPHAEVIRAFAATRPTVQAPSRTVTLPYSPDKFYQQPSEHTITLYHEFIADVAQP
jgi:endo-1,4-beta-mannosidase